MDPLVEYLKALIYLLVAAGFGAALLLLGRLIGPRRPTPEKLSPYESGNEPLGLPRRYPAHFYAVGVLFLVFDVELAFLWPYAVAARELGTLALAAVALFLLLLLVGLFYEWKKGTMRLLDREGRG